MADPKTLLGDLESQGNVQGEVNDKHIENEPKRQNTSKSGMVNK